MGSDPLPEGYQHSIEASLDLLETKLDSLGIERAHFVGNSLGGWLAIELARRGRALSVVALAPGGGWEPGSAELRRLLRIFHLTRALLRVSGPIAGALSNRALPRRYLLRDAVARPELLTATQARLLIETTSRCAAYKDVLKAIPRQPLAKPFDVLPCPMRLVWGAEDRLLPIRGYSERWRRVLPGAEWRVLEDVGHVQMYEHPKAVAESVLELTTRRTDVALRAVS